jgi:transcriptional regulator with XRE-family HTH domain
MLGLKQSDLARRADISASYLNLIEHNRRRIGGKLLLDIAGILGVEANALSEGAEATLIATLREAAAENPTTGAEGQRADEFAGRFPGWAALLADNRRRIDTLERTVAALNDRLTHDPHLAESLHDMLTTVTAIRSTASILAEPGEIEPEWQQRFHRNINEDAARLANTSRALVQYLDRVDSDTADSTSPQDELDLYLARRGHRFDELEEGKASVSDLAKSETDGLSRVAAHLLVGVMARYAEDVAAVPKMKVLADLSSTGPDPFVLSGRWGVPPLLAMRRIAALAEEAGLAPVGLALCDASGTLSYRKPVADLQFPRFGAACSMLPLYQALTQPVAAIQTALDMPGPNASRFESFAYAQPMSTPRPGAPRLLEAGMLVMSGSGSGKPDNTVEVGVSCGICPRSNCPARREPSILSEGM